jgi:hypothetical protein
LRDGSSGESTRHFILKQFSGQGTRLEWSPRGLTPFLRKVPELISHGLFWFAGHGIAVLDGRWRWFLPTERFSDQDLQAVQAFAQARTDRLDVEIQRSADFLIGQIAKIT